MQSNNDIMCTGWVHRSGVSYVLSFAAIAFAFCRGDAAYRGEVHHAHITCTHRFLPSVNLARDTYIFFAKASPLLILRICIVHICVCSKREFVLAQYDLAFDKPVFFSFFFSLFFFYYVTRARIYLLRAYFGHVESDRKF